ncbi:MAG: nicotinate-nucleotide adenylyltransferase [Pseudomonadota bacterium]
MVTLPFIAILGGSFDPIHNGHIKLADIVSQHIKNTEIYFVPCGNPVHRAPYHVSSQDRVNMIKLAIADHENWHLDTYEIDRPDPSYTLETLKHFRQRFPDNPIGFIMGMDSFLNIETWGNWQELLNYAKLIVVPREGYDQEKLLHKKQDSRIIMLPVAPPSVSSTGIREKLINRDDISSLIPNTVYDYIRQKKLYMRNQSKADCSSIFGE